MGKVGRLDPFLVMIKETVNFQGCSFLTVLSYATLKAQLCFAGAFPALSFCLLVVFE